MRKLILFLLISLIIAEWFLFNEPATKNIPTGQRVVSGCIDKGDSLVYPNGMTCVNANPSLGR